MSTFIAGVVVFSTIVATLVLLLILARAWLTGGSQVAIRLENLAGRRFTGAAGITLLEALRDQGLHVASACGGKGICGECRVQVRSGGGALLITEQPLISRREARNDFRLACQVRVRQPMTVALPEYCLSTRSFRCRVVSNRNVAAFIKELVLAVPEEQDFRFEAGAYIQVECPPYRLSYRDLEIPAAYRNRWDETNSWHLQAETGVPAMRSYSLANAPLERGRIMLNVRVATPPPERPRVPPGIVSSYIFSLKAGDEVTVSGPFGDMRVRDSKAEMVFIGGGAGMAPIRSMILDQLLRVKTRRSMRFYYGARSRREAFYIDTFEQLARAHDNFAWTLALSDPQPADDWQGPVGYIHQVALDDYLASHEAPENVEFYLCGPPPMVDACCDMLEELGVEEENVVLDRFG